MVSLTLVAVRKTGGLWILKISRFSGQRSQGFRKRPEDFRRFEFESSTIFNMIIRDGIVRATSRDCSRILRNHGIRHVRFASVSPQFLQSRPAGPPRTDYLQKYQDKLERKAKE